MDDMDDFARNMRVRSGDVTGDSVLEAFLYVLVRDHVQPGTIEEIMKEFRSVNEHTKFQATFSNGWLALYVKDVASRLTKK